jgi:hypothetical protein
MGSSYFLTVFFLQQMTYFLNLIFSRPVNFLSGEKFIITQFDVYVRAIHHRLQQQQQQGIDILHIVFFACSSENFSLPLPKNKRNVLQVRSIQVVIRQQPSSCVYFKMDIL